MTDALDARVVDWFSRRGLTLLLGGTPLERSTRERALPVLLVWFGVVTLLVVPGLTFLPLWAAGLLGVGSIVAVWALSNLARRRPPFARGLHVGPLEMAAFVIVPAVAMFLGTLHWLFDDTVGVGEILSETSLQAVGILIAQFVALVAILALERLGLITLGGWLARTFWSSLSQTGSALATSLPVSLGVVFFFFLNPGVWASIGTLPLLPYFAVIGLLLFLAAAFLGSSRHLGLPALTTFDTDAELTDALAPTPLAGRGVQTPATCPLGPLQRFCAMQVAVLSQLIVGLIIALAVFCLFLVIGWLAVDPGTAATWTRTQPPVLLKFVGVDHTYVWTVAHLKVAGFLATFTAFNYSLASATDARLRQNSKETAADLVRQACAMRLVLANGVAR